MQLNVNIFYYVHGLNLINRVPCGPETFRSRVNILQQGTFCVEGVVWREHFVRGRYVQKALCGGNIL